MDGLIDHGKDPNFYCAVVEQASNTERDGQT